MIVRKDLFRAGKYTLPDGRKIEFTDQDVLNAFKNGRKMLANQQAIPTIFEHDWNAMPVPLSAVNAQPDWPESFARKTLGHVLSYEIRKENGRPVLWSKHQIPNKADAKRWAACRFASARIDWDAEDSKGNRYPGVSVQHVAVTPRPIQVEQLPVNLSSEMYGRAVHLSMEYREMAEKTDDDTVKGGGGDDDTGASDTATFGRVTAALSTMGHTLPDSVTGWDGLAVALEVIAANGDGGASDPLDDDEGLDGGTTTSAPPVMMSAQQKKAEDRLVAVERNQLHTRAERATARLVSRGLLSADAAAKFVKGFTSVNLSFATTGEAVKNSQILQLEVYEQIAGNVKKQKNGPVDLSQTKIQKPPTLGRDEESIKARQGEAKSLLMSATFGSAK